RGGESEAVSAIPGWTQTTMLNESGAAIFIGKRFLLVRSVAQRGSDRRELLPGFAATRPRWDCVGHASATFRKPASNKEIVQPTKMAPIITFIVTTASSIIPSITPSSGLSTY